MQNYSYRKRLSKYAYKTTILYIVAVLMPNSGQELE